MKICLHGSKEPQMRQKLDCEQSFKSIPNVIQKLFFCCVVFTIIFFLSLVPCARTMVARSKKKIGAAFLQNSQLLNHVGYNSFPYLVNLTMRKTSSKFSMKDIGGFL